MAHLNQEMQTAVQELLERAPMKPAQILVLGCSTSEIQGEPIGQDSNVEVAREVLRPLLEQVQRQQLFLAVQCCEHLNRALVVEEEAARLYNWRQVLAQPVPEAGGAAAAVAHELFREPLLVESVQGHAALDLGQTLVGMHLAPVVVPVRLAVTHIGQAVLTAARTRPPLIGGDRAVYGPLGSTAYLREK